MAQTCTLTGMVLKAAPAGEYDRRITLLTREQGKVTAFARGARRPKSALQAATNLLCFGTYEAYEGRETYTVVKADIKNYFSELYTEPERAYFGCYFLELADCFTEPFCEATDQLKLLYQSVRALTAPGLDPRLVRRVYELRTLVCYGVSPNVFSCVKCGTKENLRWFSVRDHGTLCASCGGPTAHALTDSVLYTLQYILSSPLEKLYTFRVTEEVYEALARIVGESLAPYLDRACRTASFLPD